MTAAVGMKRAAHESRWRVAEGGRCDPPIMRQAVTYVLLFPLILFAVHGGFSFEQSARNSELGAIGGKMSVIATASETLRDRVQLWVALALCLGAMAPYFRRILGAAQAMPLMVVLPMYAIASAAWSQDPGLSLRSGISLLITTFFAFYLGERFHARRQLELLTVTGACIGALSVVVALSWPAFGLDHQLHEGAWQGLFTQKNACAEAMLFALSPALALSPVGRYGQLLKWLYVVLCLSIIVMTQSRTGGAITLLYLGFVFCLRWLGKLERKELLPVAAVIFAGLGTVAVGALVYPALVLSVIGRSSGLSGRVQIWGAIAASVFRRPMTGYGFDAFWSQLDGEASRVFASTGWVVTSSHNGYLNVALELGFMGLALVLVTLVQACRHASAAFRPGHSRYVEWCIGIIFLTFVYNLDERTLMATQYLPWILYIVACKGLQAAAYGPQLVGVRSRTRQGAP